MRLISRLSDAALFEIHEMLHAEAEVDKLYKVNVSFVLAEFGAFRKYLTGKDGLVHISQIAEERIRA